MNEEVLFENEKYVPVRVMANFYEVSTQTVVDWIKNGKVSGKQIPGHRGEWFVPSEEFQYLKQKEEMDDTANIIKELLGVDTKDWDVDMD